MPEVTFTIDEASTARLWRVTVPVVSDAPLIITPDVSASVPLPVGYHAYIFTIEGVPDSHATLTISRPRFNDKIVKLITDASGQSALPDVIRVVSERV